MVDGYVLSYQEHKIKPYKGDKGMNIEKLIEDFVNLKIDLIDYLLKLEHLEITNKGEFQNFIINYKETTKMDEKMNALLILWFCKYELFKDIQYDSNPYLLYINDLTKDIKHIDLEFLEVGKHNLITKIDNFYFIINHNTREINMTLPPELQEKTVFCYNCNDEMILEKELLLPEFSFYALCIE